MKPKGQWKSLGSGVYESSDKTRIHIGGLIRKSNGVMINLLSISKNPFKFIEIMGGNRKRGIMLMSEHLTKLEQAK
tara:strand:- start:7374 stop:7601 length:228 start_codon:yes stop_codon:yes gene_type:complete